MQPVHLRSRKLRAVSQQELPKRASASCVLTPSPLASSCTCCLRNRLTGLESMRENWCPCRLWDVGTRSSGAGRRAGNR